METPRCSDRTQVEHVDQWESIYCKHWWRGQLLVECVWNLMVHGDPRVRKWMEWVAITLTLPRNVVYSALPILMRTPRLPAVDWTDAPADLNGLVRFGERLNLFSAHVPSRFKRTLATQVFGLDITENNKARWTWPKCTTTAFKSLICSQ